MSLDSLRPDRFFQITQQDRLTSVLAGIDAALAAGFSPLKLNIVVMAGINDDEVLDFIAFGKERPINIRFIEFMPSRSNGWSRKYVVPFDSLKRRIEQQHNLTPLPAERQSATYSTAKQFTVPDHAGTVSFITPMSAEFCDDCNRLRLTADGSIKTCLFSSTDVNLRQMLRDGSSEEAIIDVIMQATKGKWERHPGMDKLASLDSQTMCQVGG